MRHSAPSSSALGRIDPGLLVKSGPPDSPRGEYVGVLGRIKGALAPLGGCAALDPPCALQPIAITGNGENSHFVRPSLGADHLVL